MMGLHVLMVSEYFPPHSMGGGELSAFALAKALVKRKVSVSVLTSHFPGDSEEELNEGVRVYHRLQTGINPDTLAGNLARFRLTASIVNELPKLAADIKPGIIHAMNITSMPGVAKVLPRLGIPGIAHINSPLAFDPKGTLMDGTREATAPYKFWSFVRSFIGASAAGRVSNSVYLRWNPLVWVLLYHRWAAIRNSFSAFTHFFPISTSMQDWLVKYGVLREKTTVIYNLISLERFSRRAVQKNKVPIIAYLGGYARFKGLHMVLDALKDVSGYELRCYGKGDEKKELIEQAKSNSIPAVFHDEVSQEQLPDVLARSDILVFPSQVSEGLGRVAIEAMAAGKPVIASDIGGIRDTVVNGKTGFLVKPDDVQAWRNAIMTLLKNAKLRGEFGRAGKARAFKEFTAERILGAVFTAYHKVMR